MRWTIFNEPEAGARQRDWQRDATQLDADSVEALCEKLAARPWVAWPGRRLFVVSDTGEAHLIEAFEPKRAIQWKTVS